jgi:biopolymer transport protein ExbD
MPRREAPEINGGSIADIAFMLLIFFIVATTMNVDSGIMRKLPELSDDPPEEIDQIKDRDVFDVRINYKNQLLVEGKSIDISRLREKAKEFIENPNNSDDLPQKEEIDVPFFGVYPVSKQVISLQNDRGTKYDIYIQVQNELTAAYNELRDEISKKQFHKPFDKLDEEEMKAVKKIYPMRISEAEPRRSTGGGS